MRSRLKIIYKPEESPVALVQVSTDNQHLVPPESSWETLFEMEVDEVVEVKA